MVRWFSKVEVVGSDAKLAQLEQTKTQLEHIAADLIHTVEVEEERHKSLITALTKAIEQERAEIVAARGRADNAHAILTALRGA